MEVITHKRCNTCMTVKPMEAFATRTESRDGRRHICKTCKGKQDTRRAAPRTRPVYHDPVEPKGWPLPEPPPLTVQLLNLHTKRAYGAIPMCASW